MKRTIVIAGLWALSAATVAQAPKYHQSFNYVLESQAGTFLYSVHEHRGETGYHSFSVLEDSEGRLLGVRLRGTPGTQRYLVELLGPNSSPRVEIQYDLSFFSPSTPTAPVTTTIDAKRFSYFWDDRRSEKSLKAARKAYKDLPREFRRLVDALVDLSFSNESTDMKIDLLGSPIANLTGDEPRDLTVTRVRPLTDEEVARLHGAFD